MMGRFRAKRGTLLALPTAWTGFAVMLLSCSASLADAQASGNCTEFPQLYVTRKGTTLTVVRAEPFVANQTEEDVCICSPVFDVAGVNATCSSNHSEEVNCLTLPTDDEIEVELDSKVLTENASLCLFSECGNKDCTIFDPFRDKEVTISALDVVPESSSAISLTWNVSGVYGDTVIRSHVTWCTEDNNCSVQATCLEEKPPLISERDVLHTSVRIDGLRPAASLRIRVSPVGLLGNTSEGCFLTPSEVLDPVASISAVATEINSLRISWTQPADYNDSIDSYELRYCLREENVDCPLKQQQQEGLNSCLAPGNVILKEEGTYNISGVMPGSIVLVGVNRTRRYPSGVQGSSAETVECFKAFSPGNVTNVVEQDIGSRRVSLKWNFSEEAKQHVQPSAYNVTWCVFSTDTNCTIADCKETEGNSTTVQGDTLDIEDLMPWSVVSVKVSPLYWNGSEQISLGAPGSTCFRTLAEAPATVKHLQVRPETKWAIVEWKEPERKNGPLDGYILKLCHATDNAQGSCSGDASQNLTINSSINEQRVDGLTPWTKYTVIVVAFNKDTNGSEMTSAEVVMEFQTKAAAPDNVQDLSVKTVEATSATVEWKEPKVKNGPLDGYILVWCLSSDYVQNECAEARSENTTIDSPSITEKRLTDLNPWTKYKVTVVAFNKDKNDSEMKSDIAVEEFETDGEVPGAVTRLSAIVVTDQSLSLTWATPDISPDYPQHYRITYCLTDICSSALSISDSVNWNSSECKTVNATSKDAKLPGLRPWTWFAVRVTAVSIRRDGTELFGSADAICEKTKMGVPGKPENIFAEAGIDAITISWKPPAVPNGEITSYKIYVCIVENDTCDTLNWPGNKTRVVLENMLPWTLYNVSLAAQNKEDGILLEGEAIAATVKTLSAAPSEPRKLAWNEMRENILVTWEEPENPRGPLSGYDVSWTITDWLGRTTGSDSLNTSDKEAQIPRLAYSNYTISVKAFNDLQHGARLYGAATSTAFRSAVGAPGLPAVDMEVGARTAAVYMSVQKSPNGPLDGFLWTNCPTAQNNEREACANENTPKHLIMLKKLKPWTEYTFRVRAYNLGPNNATLAGPSNFRTYKTDPAEPSVVRNFSVAKIESRTLFVNWLEPVAKNGDHPDYVLSWGPVGDSEQNHTEVTARSVALPYLQPYTEYLLEVFAYNRYQGERLQGPSSSAKARTLPEVPGPVRNLKAKPFKNNTVLLTWSAPTEPRGVLLGYVVIYNATKPDKPSKPTVEIKDDSLLSSSACEGSQCTFELRGLAAEYRYIFDVRGINVNVTGLGDPVGSPEVILLPAGDPPPPKNLSLMTPDCPSAPQPDSQKAFVFSKDMFDDTNGEIIYYEVVVGSAGLISENITAQQAWSELSRKQPTPPHKITPKGWNPFKKGVDSVDPLNCQPMHGETDTVVCTIGLEKCDSTNMEPCNGPLRGGTEYALYVIGHTHGGSRSSDPEVFVTALLPETSSAGAIVGGILTAVVIMVAILAVLIIHRRRLARQKQAKRPSCDSANMNNSVDHFISRSDVNGIPRKPIPPVPQEETIEMEHHVIKDINKPIPKTEFKEYLEMMLKDSGYRFADEYERLVELSPQYPSDVARNPANSKKNRFTNIHPFDKSRVPLSVLGEDEQTSYINASFVKGCNSDREYIAAQGPNSLTVNDFWRMIWEHDVKTIIMLTQFVEANKKKCEKYWPDDNKEHAYGSVLVRKDTSTDFNDYTLTEFKIKSDDSSKWRNVRHIFFTAWKDHGVPEKPQTLIQFVRTCQGMFGRRGGAQPPILVHCSAGVGRTGTFIALDMCLQKLELEDDIDIFHLILDLRECRRCMVQNEKQYTYLYHCVAAVIDEMGGKTIQDEPIYENVSVLLSGSTC